MGQLRVACCWGIGTAPQLGTHLLWETAASQLLRVQTAGGIWRATHLWAGVRLKLLNVRDFGSSTGKLLR